MNLNNEMMMAYQMFKLALIMSILAPQKQAQDARGVAEAMAPSLTGRDLETIRNEILKLSDGELTGEMHRLMAIMEVYYATPELWN
jgi:hypothetical protein